MEQIPLEAMGAGGVLVVFFVGLALWKMLKLALKLALFFVVAAVLAGGVALYLERAPPALPIKQQAQ